MEKKKQNPEITLKGKKYRCIMPRTTDLPMWCGCWDFWNERFQRWDKLRNYNLKIELNKIIEKK